MGSRDHSETCVVCGLQRGGLNDDKCACDDNTGRLCPRCRPEVCTCLQTASPSVRLTYAELKAALDALTPEQLAQPVVWCGDERGGYVKEAFVHVEDWVGESSDRDSWVPRSDVGKAVSAEEYADADVCIPAGTVYLMVDE